MRLLLAVNCSSLDRCLVVFRCCKPVTDLFVIQIGDQLTWHNDLKMSCSVARKVTVSCILVIAAYLGK